MHEIICFVADQFEIVPVFNGKSNKKEVIPPTLFGGADAHLVNAGVFVALGASFDVIVIVYHSGS